MIYNKSIVAQLLGVLFKHPEKLSDSDKYTLTTDDFAERLHRMIFGHIYNLYYTGMEKFDVESFVKEISKYPEQLDFFQKSNGQDFLINAIEMGMEENFDFYYNKIKKLSLLRALKSEGFDVSDWYMEDLIDIKKRELLERKLEDATLEEILNSIQMKYFDIESKFVNKKTFEIATAATNIRDLLDHLSTESAVGLPLNGDYFSTVVLGARKTKVLSLSGASGAGKSRFAVANACKLAFPILWDSSKGEWANTGSNQKVLFITTELTFDEIQTIMLAYISGVDESNLLNRTLTPFEEDRIYQAVCIMEHFEDNFFLYHMPDPNVQQLNMNVRRYAIRFQLDAVFYDYIHTSPNLLNEFAGTKIREDVALMLLSTALKNLANELNIFVWTGTQVNSEVVEGKMAGVNVIRGSKAVIDKVDTACVLRKVTPEDLKLIHQIVKQKSGVAPTHTIDIFKNRRGKYNDIRIWLKFDLGTMRSTDLFITDPYGQPLSIQVIKTLDAEAIIENMVPYLFPKDKEETSSSVIFQD